MQLEGSCHCAAVQFGVQNANPYPYQRCYCSICRKTQGGGGYSINLSADARTMKLTGGEYISIYHALLPKADSNGRCESTAERHCCNRCDSALWLFSPEWPDLIHPFASAIDTDLPVPPERTHLFLDNKASWVEISARPADKIFEGYPEESIAQWHERLGLDTE